MSFEVLLVYKHLRKFFILFVFVFFLNQKTASMRKKKYAHLLIYSPIALSDIA